MGVTDEGTSVRQEGLMEAQPMVRDVLDLGPMIEEVVNWRRFYASIQITLKEARAEWDRENELLLANVKAFQDKLAAAENRLRSEALANYAATGDKQVAPGIEVKIVKVVGFEPDKALEWATAHQIALCLDEKAYKALVLGGHAPGSVLQQPQVYLARELGSTEEA